MQKMLEIYKMFRQFLLRMIKLLCMLKLGVICHGIY